MYYNSIQIFSIEEIQPLKHLSIVSYKCQNCGKDVTIRVKALKDKKRSTLKCTSCYKKETMIKKYGTTSNFGRKEVQEKSQNSLQERYGGKTPLQCKNIKEKYEQTCLEKYGSISPLGNDEIREKIQQTSLKKYGKKTPLENKIILQKTFQTIKEKYGVDNIFMIEKFRNPEKRKETISNFPKEKLLDIRKKQSKKYYYDNLYFNSSWELAFWIYSKDNNKKIKYEPTHFEYYYDNKKHYYYPDFQVDDELIEIKGDHFFENGKMICPFDRTLDGLYETKHQCMIKNHIKILKNDDLLDIFNYIDNKYTKDFIDLFLVDLPFPYLNPDLKTKTDYGLIQHFHKSIFQATKKGKLSPLEAWNDKNLIKKSALNRLKYVGRCTPTDVLRGFSVTRIAPKISVFKPSLAENLIKKYLMDYDTIIDPFSGFSGRLIGSMNCNKQYIGKDINEDHVRESNQIIQYKKYQNCSIEIEDLISAPVREYENSALFTCPPYGGKEHWNENNDEIELSCDEWIDLCLKKYWCNKYLFVVDTTEKYKDYIVEDIEHKNGLFKKQPEFVILISNIKK